MAGVILNEDNSPKIEAIWESLNVCGGDKVATSTPNGPTETRTIRRKSRRSWFDKKPTKYEIAVEKKQTSKGRKKSDVDDEILMLTHFTNPPKISFGNIKQGTHKTRTLIIRNPHDYEQSVKVEKFPHKKKFSVENLEFTVEPKGTFLFEILWEPEEEGNFREMILFVVDNSYRLQGFVFGSVEAPPKKKFAKRKGLLGSKVQRPFSVLHTQSLANIKKSYSPQKGDKKGENDKVKSQSGAKEKELPKEIIIPGEATCLRKNNDPHSDIENEPPTEEINHGDKENIPKRERRKSRRRSNTYVKMHDLDMSPIGIPPGTGKKTDHNDILHSTVRSDIDGHVLPNELKDAENLTPKTPDKMKQEKVLPIIKGFVSPNSFLHDSLCKNNESLNNQTEEKIAGGDNNHLPEKRDQKQFLSPDTFLKELNTTLDKDKKDICSVGNIPSPDSVLNNSIPHNIVVQQLDTVKTALQKKKPVFAEKKRRQTGIEQQAKNNLRSKTTSVGVRRLSNHGTFDNKSNNACRRETFVKSKGNKKANPFVDVPDTCTSSPRRTTFIVKQKQNNNCITKPTNLKDKSKQNGHQHFEKDVVVTETVVQNEVETVSTTKYTEIVDTYTCTTVTDKEAISTQERSLPVNQQTTTTTKTEISKVVDSNTVTKNRTLPTPERSSCGKQLFSPHTGQMVHGTSLNCKDNSFGSPRRLPDSPLAAVVNQRASTTVTKERPSDALLEQTEKRLSTCLFGQEDEKDDSIDDDSLEDKPVVTHDISVIQEETEHCFTPSMSKTSTKQTDMNFELDTPMREAGFTQAAFHLKNNQDTPCVDTSQIISSENTKSGNENYTEVIHRFAEIDTPLKFMLKDDEGCKTKEEHKQLDNNVEIDTPMKTFNCKNIKTENEQYTIGKSTLDIKQCEVNLDMSLNMLNIGNTLDNGEDISIMKKEEDYLATRNVVVDESETEKYCKDTFHETNHGTDLNLDTPLRLLASQGLNFENKEHSKVRRRSFWDKPCDLSITFEKLDTPMREVNGGSDNVDDRRKSRRSFWEKVDESDLKPIILKGINCSGENEQISVDSLQNAEQKSTSSSPEIDNSQQFDISDDKEKNTSFPTTPYHLLPKTPNPDNSRRSTHVVEKPKVLNLDNIQKKKLFDNQNVSYCSDKDQSDGLKGTSSKNVSESNIDKEEGNITESFKNQIENENKKEMKDNCVSDVYVTEFSRTCSNTENRNSPTSEPNLNDYSKLKEKDTVKLDGKEEHEKEVQSGLIFVSCSPPKSDGRPKTTVGIQPMKSAVTGVKGKRSPKRALSRTKNPENKRQKIKETLPQTAQVQKVKNRQVPKTNTSNKENVMEGRKRQITRSTVQQHVNKQINKGGSTVQGRVQAPVKGVAQSKLLLMKKMKTALPKHPLPFASKNMYYDERWMEKQERGFVHWLNFVLTPADEYQQTKKVKVDAGSLCVDSGRNNVKLAPTREVLSFRAYAERRRLNQLRRLACRLFQSEEVVRVIQKVEIEVESDRLYIRKDRKVHADLGLKQAILDMLLSFNPLWLRICLETTFGEMIPLQTNGDVIGLSRFIITRLLDNPEIANEFSHPSVPHLYKDGYAEATNRHLLKKFLILIFFLDHAKSKRLVPQDPCLFCKDVEFKNCKSMLIEFSRDYLAGEGDITRHLGYLGYQIKHTQTAIDEFDYAVSNLATDLRDGIRLTRVLEILSEDHTMTKRMRAPAISRLQKIHNMDLVFKTLAKHGVTVDQNGTKVMSRDIVDGHREKTLKLMWALIVQYQVSLLLNKEQLKEEIAVLEKSLRVKNQLAALQRYEQIISERKRESVDPDLFSNNEIVQLLLKWCRVICAYYNIKVENFTVSFGDGRVLCHLIHHYHPSLLPRKVIHLQTMLTLADDTEDEQSHDNSLSGSFGQDPFTAVQQDSDLFEKLLANEKENFRTLYEKVSELGGIPLMLRSADMSNTIPDEKVVVTYVSYLCARLLDIRHESRAARVIQLAWRRHHLKKVHREYLFKQKAVIVLQRAVRSFLLKRRLDREHQAAVTVQTTWRGYRARKHLKQLKWKRDNQIKMQAAIVIQRYMVACKDRRHYQKTIKATLCIQAAIRSYIQNQKFRKIIKSVKVIQSKFRANKLMEKCRAEFMEKKSAAIKIQSIIRMFNARKEFRIEKSAVKIQTFWRMYVCRKTYKQYLSSAVRIQSWFRMNICKHYFTQLKKSAVTLQRHVLAYLLMKKLRQGYQNQRWSCIKIQRWWRLRVKMRNIEQISAALKIQSAFKCYSARKNFCQTRNNIIKIQAFVRMCLVKKRQRQQQEAAIKIQESYRRHLQVLSCQRQFTCKRNAIIYLQACFRQWKCVKQYKQIQNAVVTIQSHVRAAIATKDLREKKNAVSLIQVFYRARLAMVKEKIAYMKMRDSCITIQSHWRGFQVRQNTAEMHKAATLIQSRFRGQMARDYYLCLKELVIKCQRYWRAKLNDRIERARFLQQKMAATLLQAAFRKYAERKRYNKILSNVVKIQSHVRGHQKRKKFLKLRTATLVVQRHYRAVMVGKNVRLDYLAKKGAAITIQAFIRGFRVRNMIGKLNSAAIVIQSVFRMFSQRQKFIMIKKSAITCQRRYQAKRQGQKVRSEYLGKRTAAVKIQSNYRRFKVQREINKLNTKAIVIQSAFKGYKIQKYYQQTREAVINCQKLYRAKVLGLTKRYEFLQKKVAALVIQRHFRHYRIRQKVKKTHNAAMKIQSCFRCYRERKHFLKLREVVKTWQSLYRNKMVGKCCRRQFLKTKYAIVIVQAGFRGWKVRKEVKRQHKAASLIQSVYRGYKQRKTYTCLRRKVISCQRIFRAHVLGNQAHKEFMKTKGAIITFQAGFRGLKVRKEVKRQHKAASLIQSVYRGYKQQKTYTCLRQTVMSCQRIYRAHVLGNQAHKEFMITKGAVITLQAGFRGWKVRKEVKRQHKAASLIQSVYRRYKQRKTYTCLRRTVMSCQRIYRAHVLGNQGHGEFMKTKGAIITLQAGFRSWKVRKEVKRQHKAASLIQSVYRRYKQRKTYTCLRRTVMSCQRIFRAHVLGNRAHKEFMITKGAVITLQAGFRGWKVRKEGKRQHKAASLIQSVYRRYKQRKTYTCLRHTVMSCQRIFRAHVLGNRAHKEFMITKGAVITLQAGFRGWKVRKEGKRQHKAASLIQSVYRRYKQRKTYTCLKRTVMSCQRIYRAHVLGNSAHREFMITKGAVITLQAGCRGWMVRKHNKLKSKAATVIQSAYKRHVQRKKFISLKQATVACQRIYRTCVLGLKCQREFLIQKGAVITLQAGVRGWKVRIDLRRQNSAATIIQSVYRGHVQHRDYILWKQAVIRCQHVYRRYFLGSHERKKYLKTKNAVTKLQAGFRGWKVRQEVKRCHRAATIIQSMYKKFIHLRKFLNLKQATLKCQERYRAKVLGLKIRRQYLIQKGAALVIEDWYCDCLQRRKEQVKQRAVILIQSYFRGHKTRLEYRKLQQAAQTIQWHFRNYQATKLVRGQYLSMRSSAVLIQKCYRGHLSRKKYLEDLERVCRIQSVIKSYLLRKHFLVFKSAVLYCQRKLRAEIKGQQQRKVFLEQRSAAVLLQSHVRGWIERKNYQSTGTAVVIIQKTVRKYLAHKDYKSVKSAVNVIQVRWRATLLMRQVKRSYLIKKGCSITIQSWWRGHIARKNYRRKLNAIVKLQAMVRRNLQHQKFVNLKSSACVIQSHLRAYLLGKETRTRFMKMKESVVKLQALLRAYHARIHLKRIRACLHIQSHYRRHMCRRKYNQIRSSVIKIQSKCRGLIERRKFQTKMQAVAKIQKFMRNRLFVRRLENYFEVRQKSAITIQALVRGHRVREMMKKTRAAILIQSVTRMNLQRQKFHCYRRNIIMIQSCIRRYLAKKISVKLRNELSAATCIQTAYRQFKQRQLFELQRTVREQHLKRITRVTWVNLAAIVIQRCYRKHQMILQAKEKLHKIVLLQRWIRSRLCRLRYLKIRKTLVLIQRKARLYLQRREHAAVKIQAAIRIWFYITKQKKREQAVIKLQALWRGEQVRRRSIGKKIEIIRKRVEKANRSATEENKLGNRMASALDYLLRYKQLSHILEVLIHLDVATRLSAACCEKFVSVNAVQVIYRLLRGCNRSQPHMELIKYSVSILLNLAKYEKTVYEVYNVEGSIDALIELMQIYREKGAIFNSTCMLLGILGMLDKCRMELKEDKKLSEKVRSIHLLTARKHKLDETRQLRQARLLAAKSFNCSLPVHIPHKKQHRITPDWVLRKDKMKEIQDPLTAINFVMESFQLKPK